MRPDLLQAKVDLERQGVVLRYLRNQRLPQLDLVGSYALRGSDRAFGRAAEGVGRGDSPSYTVGLELSIPLGGNRSAKESYKASQVEWQQALLRLKRLEQSVLVEIGVALEHAQTRLAQVAATKQSREFAELALTGEQKKLERGRSTAFVVLQLQRDLTAARLAELTAIAEYNKALAELALREGATLERNKLNITFEES